MVIKMKVLSIKEPWASLIVNGYKKYEFRTWNSKYRGKFYIQASLKPDLKNLDRFKDFNLDYSSGEIIGEAEIYDVIKCNKEFVDKLRKDNKLVYDTSDYDSYAFALKNIKKYDKNKRIKIKGKLGFFELKKE